MAGCVYVLKSGSSPDKSAAAIIIPAMGTAAAAIALVLVLWLSSVLLSLFIKLGGMI
jgi:hypothetical protein